MWRPSRPAKSCRPVPRPNTAACRWALMMQSSSPAALSGKKVSKERFMAPHNTWAGTIADTCTCCLPTYLPCRNGTKQRSHQSPGTPVCRCLLLAQRLYTAVLHKAYASISALAQHACTSHPPELCLFAALQSLLKGCLVGEGNLSQQRSRLKPVSRPQQRRKKRKMRQLCCRQPSTCSP
jgi:hypothetical protein